MYNYYDYVRESHRHTLFSMEPLFEGKYIYSTPETCGSTFNNSQLPIIRGRIVDFAAYPYGQSYQTYNLVTIIISNELRDVVNYCPMEFSKLEVLTLTCVTNSDALL